MIKMNNKLNVISYIREHVITDRQSVSTFLGINVSTSKRIVDDLVSEGVVRYLGVNESTGGRKSTKIGINYNYGLNLVIKVEVDKLIFSLVDFEPKVLNHLICEFPVGTSFEEIETLLKENIVKMIVEANALSTPLFSVGIAISGVVSRDSSTLISSTLLGWQNIEFKNLIESWFKIPTYVENDVNCAVIAEHWYGKGRGLNSFVLLTLGKGTGSGIVLDNLLFKGSFGGAGEIGHSIFEKDGKQCYCGQKGCLEMYTNEDYLLEQFGVKQLTESMLEKIYNKDKEKTQKVLNDFAVNIISGIINLVVVIEPERIVIGGEMSYIYNYVADIIAERVNANWINSLHQSTKVDVVKSDLGSDSFVKGLAVKLMSKVFEKQY
ncbi:N-acetylglucosamine repressor [Candidatus Izimaplasma bacterium HR1]|jgi:predicted NBD/HSP70 family sugar kinase|uniref:ROK family protein n=1 Tax=Candidatus Izimoplasma sp. HR1 TaxID=1541959 RepID=UPI0004F6B835|nr:N-acetylglucosamine repressor [Candidatus Izimaplasma bacterium HR1]